MNNLNISHQKLDVPYFKQTRISTCGPAALMMVIKYWDKSFEFSKRIESQIWMKSNPFVFLGGTLQFGLAKTADKLGFKTKIYQKARFSDYYPSMKIMFNLYEHTISIGARRANIPIYYGQEILNVIHKALTRKIPPIVFINLEPILGENVFHWLVVIGMDKQNIYVNDPYIPQESMIESKKGVPIKLNIFQKAIATDLRKKLRLPPCVILVYK